MRGGRRCVVQWQYFTATRSAVRERRWWQRDEAQGGPYELQREQAGAAACGNPGRGIGSGLHAGSSAAAAVGAARTAVHCRVAGRGLTG